MRRRHVVGLGILGSVIGAYQFAAQFGLVPRDPTALLRSLPVATQPYAPGQAREPANDQGAYHTSAYGAANYGGDIFVRFSPAGGCTDAVVTVINQARQQILVQAYSFTSAPIANALVDAHAHGVAVYVILDKSQKTEQYSAADYLAQSGVPTFIDSAHAIAHNKVMLIDGQTIITGSFNFTTNAERSNAENLLVIRDRADLYAAYEDNFRHHYQHSEPHHGKLASSPRATPTNAYPPTNGYSQPNSYPPANGYSQPNSYPPANGYSQPNVYPPDGYAPAAGYPANGGVSGWGEQYPSGDGRRQR